MIEEKYGLKGGDDVSGYSRGITLMQIVHTCPGESLPGCRYKNIYSSLSLTVIPGYRVVNLHIHPYSSILIHTYPYSSIRIHTHPYSSILIQTHPYSSILIHTHPYSSMLIHAHPYSS